MNNLSMDIGALELGVVAGFNDGALEAAASLAVRQPATAHWRPGLIPCMNDGALEAAAMQPAFTMRRAPNGQCF